MKILWTIAKPVGIMRSMIEGAASISTSGSWIDVSARELIRNGDVELVILSTVERGEVLCKNAGEITYIGVPIGDSYLRKSYSPEDVKLVVDTIHTQAPDVIHIWGTECLFSQIVAEGIKDIPKLLSLQGIMQAIAKYPNGGLTKEDLCVSPLSRLLYLRYLRSSRYYEFSSSIEKMTIKEVDGVISDSNWCFMWCRHIDNSVKCYNNKMPVNEKYVEDKWDNSCAHKNTIFTVADRSGYKGIQMLLKAVGIVKRHFPGVVVIIPGKPVVSNRTRWTDIYAGYIKRLIKKYDIHENVVFAGAQDTDGMIRLMKESSLFVMPSACENHAMSLREAMTFGMPCVSSFVGSIGEYVDNYKNAVLYRYEEYEVLAEVIIRILSDNSFAAELGKNARESMLGDNILNRRSKSLKTIYGEVMSDWRARKACTQGKH
jgi:glycosyltransferase involved in cell wall biosynthesis